MDRVLIVGATSAIAEATARLYAARGARLHLLARDAERLASLARDLEVRGASAVSSATCDFARSADWTRLVSAAREALGGLELVLVAHGVLSDQAACEQDIALLREVFEINTLATLGALTVLANVMQREGRGTLAVLSSVAGDRGRQSNYVYGASKATLDAFLSGLRNRLHRHGVRVLTIKPGFVATPMTTAFKKTPLWVTPEVIAAGIVRAVAARRDVVYLPWFWRPIMFAIRALPEWVFKRLSL